ncbi:MAG: crossover junction endodeoxyribonuclease RuvC [Patescibacteria group bacterium]|jgi:crossover junction endodeoxyribonuclease RuvC
MTSPLRVLGVDPGFGRTGLGVVDMRGSDATHVWHDVIETQKEQEFADRLQTVRNDLQEAIRRFSPQCAVVESLFFQTNVTTAMKVGMARGVILLALADANIPVIDLTPNQVKQGIAGYGAADKKQVQEMVKRLLKLDRVPKLDDAADALALAIVGGLMYRSRRIG